MGCIMTVLLGIRCLLAGSFGQWIGWYVFPSWIGFVVAVVFAIVIIAIYDWLKRR